MSILQQQTSDIEMLKLRPDSGNQTTQTVIEVRDQLLQTVTPSYEDALCQTIAEMKGNIVPEDKQT